ncbi:MAG: AAA family ATPase [bacterium]
MKNLPIGIQTFEKIINDNLLYIDKTKIIFELIKNNNYFFLSRPRRFGKSLLLSTLKEIFSGNKELFKGLFIYDKIEWLKYPVIHLSMSDIKGTNNIATIFESTFFMLKEQADKYNIIIDNFSHPALAFKFLIHELSKINKVVILIDEYDKPILDNITKPDYANLNKDFLKEFYSVIKDSDQYIKFVFLTGVSKFSKVSLFSGLNNLRDITFDQEFSTICGCTPEELDYYFNNRYELTSDKLNLSIEELKTIIKLWYNGYSWDGIKRVYNPYSILNFFQLQKFSNFWFTTGTPTFLVDKFIQDKISVNEIIEDEVTEYFFEDFDTENIDYRLLLFQTGYLTIKSINTNLYKLHYPNKEVMDSYLTYIATVYLPKDADKINLSIIKINNYLSNKKYDDFFITLKSLFASIPYMLKKDNEAYYHSIFYIIMLLMGADIEVEKITSKGRIDGVIEYDDIIYIIEIKYLRTTNSINKLLSAAINQIKEKEYYMLYLAKNKQIKLIAIAINNNTLEYKIE